MKRQVAEISGRAAENRAALRLEGQGWQIIDRRLKTKRGEIDLIARDGNAVVFVEVKWRRSAEQFDLAINEYRLRRVAAAADAVAHECARSGEDLRIDVLLLAPGVEPPHIIIAWTP
ncbi:MAG: YraN family protein [Alphaproteobacteria bacterium]|nr:YraN family protein [Alphaproteobacteria bacterium]